MTKNQVNYNPQELELFVASIVKNDFNYMSSNHPGLEDKLKEHGIYWGEIYSALEGRREIVVTTNGMFIIRCATPDNVRLAITCKRRGDYLRTIGVDLE